MAIRRRGQARRQVLRERLLASVLGGCGVSWPLAPRRAPEPDQALGGIPAAGPADLARADLDLGEHAVLGQLLEGGSAGALADAEQAGDVC